MLIEKDMHDMSLDDILKAIKQVQQSQNDKQKLLNMLIKSDKCGGNTFLDLKLEIETDIETIAHFDEEIIRRNNTILKFRDKNYTVIQLIKKKSNLLLQMEFANNVVSAIADSGSKDLIDNSLLAYKKASELQEEIKMITKTIYNFNNTKGKDL